MLFKRRVVPTITDSRLSNDRWQALLLFSKSQLTEDIILSILLRAAEDRNYSIKYKAAQILAMGGNQEQTKEILSKLSPTQFDILARAIELSYRSSSQSKKVAPNAASILNISESDDQIKEMKTTKEQVIETVLYHLNDLTHNINLFDALSELNRNVGDTITHNFQDELHHIPESGSAQSTATHILLPFSGIFGAYQVGYEASTNNAFLRNAYSEYINEIQLLDKRAIDTVLKKYKNNPTAQIEELKLIAKNNVCNKIFNNTWYSGTLYSLFFSTLLAIGVPLPFPLSLIYAGLSAFGSLVSFGAASNNKKILAAKINNFIDQINIDDEVARMIMVRNRIDEEAVDVMNERTVFKSISMLNRAAANILRFSVLVYSGLLAVVPFALGLLAFIDSALTLRPVRAYLQLILKNPLEALHGGAYIDIEKTSLFSYPTSILKRIVSGGRFRQTKKSLEETLGRNLFKTYLHDIKGLDQLEMEIAAAGLDIKPATTLRRNAHKIFGGIGFWESDRFDQILRTIYDGTDIRAVQILARLRSEASEYAFEKSLNEYLSQNHQRLKLDKDLQKIREDHLNGDSKQFYSLLRNYMQDNTVNNANKAIFNSGFVFYLSMGLLAIGIGLVFFSPIAPYIAAGAIVLLAVGYVATKIYQRWWRKDISKALKSVDNDQFIDRINNSRLTYLRKFASKNQSTYATQEPKKLLETDSVIKALRVHRPKQRKSSNIFESLKTITGILSKNPIDTKTEALEMQTSSDSITIVSHQHLASKHDVQQKLLTVPSDLKTDVNLHNGSRQGWQIFFAFMRDNDKHEADFTLKGANINARAQSFVEALLFEFASEKGINNVIKFKFRDFDTAYAIYQVLQNDKLVCENGREFNRTDMEKLRAHFGLMHLDEELVRLSDTQVGDTHWFLVPNHYQQNLPIFDKYWEQIKAKRDSELTIMQEFDQHLPTRNGLNKH